MLVHTKTCVENFRHIRLTFFIKSKSEFESEKHFVNTIASEANGKGIVL